MLKEMRRQDRKLEEEETIRILENGEYGILSTIGTDGYPYGVPVSYVYREKAIYFHCAADVGLKLANIKNNDKVSFTVVGKTQVLPEKFGSKYESAIVFGTAMEATGDEKTLGLIGLLEKYSADYLEEGMKYLKGDFERTGVFKILIEQLTGKARKH